MLYTPVFGFSYPLEALSLCTPCWAVYNLHPLLGRAMACIYCWYVLLFVSITSTCYRLYPLLVRATACIHKLLLLTSPFASVAPKLGNTKMKESSS